MAKVTTFTTVPQSVPPPVPPPEGEVACRVKHLTIDAGILEEKFLMMDGEEEEESGVCRCWCRWGKVVSRGLYRLRHVQVSSPSMGLSSADQGTRRLAYLSWVFLSFLVAVTCTFSYTQPTWIERRYTWSTPGDTPGDHLLHLTLFSAGFFSYCQSAPPGTTPPPSLVCHPYDTSGLRRHLDFTALPSLSWKASCVLYGAGSCLLCVAALLTAATWRWYCRGQSAHHHLGGHLEGHWSGWAPEWARRVTRAAGHAQLLAVLLMSCSLMVWPAGFGAAQFSSVCGDQSDQTVWSPYSSGHCSTGWGFSLAAVGTALAIFCPYLARCTT